MKPVLVLLALVIPMFSQSPAIRPSFEVASIKGNSTSRPRVGTEPGGRFVASGVPLQVLIGNAYRGTLVEFSSKPSWVDTDLWDIEAKAPEGSVPPRTGPPDMSKPDTMGLMLQSLLEDRFQIRTHRETKQVPMYEVSIAPGGLKMKLSEDQTPPARPDGPPRGGGAPRGGMRMARGDFEGSAVSIANIVMTIGQLSGRMTTDKTGLNGLYDFRLQWTPDPFAGPLPFEPRGAAAAAAPPPPSDPTGPSLVTAIQEQLGLKLESTKGAVEVLVIDSVQKPSVN
jgi:bla regulator protein blaR1